MMRRLLFCLLFYLLLLPALCGCSAWIPGQQAAEWAATKAGPPISIAGALDPRAATIANLLPLLGQVDPFGSVLPVRAILKDSTAEAPLQFLICQDKLIVKCANIPMGARLKVTGRSRAPGVWDLDSLSASDFND